MIVEEEQIRKAIANGDPEAMEWLMNHYAGLLWKIAHSILHHASTEEIEECVADTFFAFWQNPVAFQSGRSSLKNYLARLQNIRQLIATGNLIEDLSLHMKRRFIRYKPRICWFR